MDMRRVKSIDIGYKRVCMFRVYRQEEKERKKKKDNNDYPGMAEEKILAVN